MSETQRCTGKVKWFNNLKGFGFIAPDGGGDDLLVHQSSIVSDGGFRTLSENQEVEFSIVLGDNKKTKAVEVTGPNGAPLVGKGGKSRDQIECFTCGSLGHIARDCPQEPAAAPRSNSNGACFKCNQFGHLARDCSADNVAGGAGSARGSCYNCGRFGHLARDCAQGGREGGGGRGSGGDGGCYHCGEAGHFARECPQKTQSGGGRSGGECYICRKPGHFARDCTTASA